MDSKKTNPKSVEIKVLGNVSTESVIVNDLILESDDITNTTQKSVNISNKSKFENHSTLITNLTDQISNLKNELLTYMWEKGEVRLYQKELDSNRIAAWEVLGVTIVPIQPLESGMAILIAKAGENTELSTLDTGFVKKHTHNYETANDSVKVDDDGVGDGDYVYKNYRTTYATTENVELMGLDQSGNKVFSTTEFNKAAGIRLFAYIRI